MKSTSSLVIPMLPNTSAMTGMQALDLVALVVPADVLRLGERGDGDGTDGPSGGAHRYSL